MSVQFIIKEGVIVVNLSKAILQIDNFQSILKPNDVLFVSGNVSHSLSLEKDFKTVMTLFVNSTI